MNRRQITRYGTAMAAAALLATGCSSSPSTATPPAATPTPTTSSTGTSSATATASPSATPTVSASSTAALPTRTSAALRKALLGLKDVPAGFELTSDSADDGSRASSPRAECAPLVRLLNEAKMSGSQATATVSFDGGEDGPALDETLNAAKSVSTAVGYVNGYRKAVKNCGAVTYSVPGIGKSTLQARAISFDDMGDDSFAARFSATSGALDGFEVIQVEVQTEDIVLDLSFFSTDPRDAQDATSAALDKAQTVLGTSSSNG